MGEGLRLGQDVLNRTSKVRAEGREIAEVHEKRLANNPAWPNDVLMSSRIKPPPLTALARCKMSSTRCQIPARISDRNRRRSSAASTRSARGLQLPMPFSSWKRSQNACRRTLDIDQPFSYLYEMQSVIAWKTPQTCIPPPICMSALGSQTALI
jgi:hypothetical protein